MSLDKLRTELTSDPLGIGYAGMTDAQVVASLLAVNRPGAEREVIPSYEILEATVPAEWATLTAQEKQRYQTLISAGQVNLRGANTRAMLGAMFGAGTTTRANMLALQTGPVKSRAEELGLGEVREGDVQIARANL